MIKNIFPTSESVIALEEHVTVAIMREESCKSVVTGRAPWVSYSWTVGLILWRAYWGRVPDWRTGRSNRLGRWVPKEQKVIQGCSK